MDADVGDGENAPLLREAAPLLCEAAPPPQAYRDWTSCGPARHHGDGGEGHHDVSSDVAASREKAGSRRHYADVNSRFHQRERISETLYGTLCEDSSTQLPRTSHVAQSRRLPPRLARFLACVLGTPARQCPLVAGVLHALTLLSALSYLAMFTWYTAHDIASTRTKRTAVAGVAGIAMAAYWCSLGLYARRLARRLVSDARLSHTIRMHTRTVATVGLGWLVGAGATAVTATTGVRAARELDAAHCRQVALPAAVCVVTLVARLTHAVFSLAWNLVVGGVLLSVCRTHTIGIRRFIRELEREAKVHESHYVGMYRWRTLATEPLNVDSDDDFFWDDADIASFEQQPEVSHDQAGQVTESADYCQTRPASDPPSYPPDGTTVPTPEPNGVQMRNPIEIEERFEELRERASSVGSLSLVERQTFTVDDILMRYWKILHRLRETSEALQRWMVAWVFFILAWSASFIVSWISREATLFGIADFVLPILILPLVCSAFAEVNNEGKRLVKCIYPTEDRLRMLYFIHKQPLEMTTFGFPVNYSTIVTALGAIAIAFCSRIVLDEIKM